MNKPRRKIWRVLLSILLGLGVWWGIDWWLSPRAFLELKYPLHDAVKRARASDPDLSKYGDVKLRDRLSWHARVWDRSSRYLLVMEMCSASLKGMEVYDLVTGKLVASHQDTPLNLHWTNITDTHHRAGTDGAIYVLKPCYGYPEPAFSERTTTTKAVGKTGVEVLDDLPIRLGQAPFLNDELWTWNALTNEARLVKKYPVGRRHTISQDGCTILEIERATPLMPSLLLPSTLPNLLASQAQSTLCINDLTIMRVYALPDEPCRCTVAVPWMDRQTAQLTCDGVYLVLPDAVAPQGFTSDRSIKLKGGPYGQARGLPGTLFDQQIYAASPAQLRVYDARHGQLRWEKKSFTPYYSLEETDIPGMIKFEAYIRPRGPFNPDILLQLPSGQEASSRTCFSFARINSNSIHCVQINDSNDGFAVAVVYENGSCEILPFQGLSHDPKMLPDAPQYVMDEQSIFWQILPQWLSAWLLKHDYFTEWLRKSTYRLLVKDYRTHRTLWTMQSSTPQRYDVTDRWLLVHERDEVACRISLYAVPFPSWSLWWACGGGIITCMLCWFTLCRIHSRVNCTPLPPAS